jgi:hypothetical protein
VRCPICGGYSDTTSLICAKHLWFIYDKDGKLIDRVDFKLVSASWLDMKYKWLYGEYI